MARLLALAGLFCFALPAADITGIWVGQVLGRANEKQDLAFQFKQQKGSIQGLQFGDEFDLPVEELKLDGEHVSFSVTSTNYYDGQKIKFTFEGIVSSQQMTLKRQRVGATPQKNTQTPDQEITLKKLAN